MCGIGGIINFNKKQVQEEKLELMISKMHHRGPDSQGKYCKNNIGLCHVRLSIIDLSSSGHQPMFSYDDRFCIVFNGEIYNYLELKEEIGDYNYKTNTDTEVIFAAYQKWGTACLDKFNGMWSFALFDQKENKVFMARDRYGIKPFYYYQNEETLIFGSSIKSILSVIPESPQEDSQKIYEYFLYNITDHTEQTFIKQVKKVQPGHFLELDLHSNSISNLKWYDLQQRISLPLSGSDDFLKTMTSSINLRLRSDVPVGVCLSGGLDSSTIVSLLVKEFNRGDIHTFSAVYGKNIKGDESNFIKLFENWLQNIHYIKPNENTLRNDIEDFLETHIEPISGLSPYSQYKVFEEATKYVTVVLDGQGADEYLAGYDHFYATYHRELFRKLKWLSLINEIFLNIKNGYHKKTAQYSVFYALPISMKDRLANRKLGWLKEDFYQTNSKVSKIGKILYDPKSVHDSMFQYFMYKLESLLKYEDLNSMRFSIESRVPFLDYRLVEGVLAMPTNKIINKSTTKVILREAIKNIVPDEIRQRRDKVGFDNPAGQWLKSKKMNDLVQDVIHSQLISNCGYFNVQQINRKYNLHQKGQISIPNEIWKWVHVYFFLKSLKDKE